MGCSGCEMFKMWDVQDVGCWGVRDVGDVAFSGCRMSGMWDVRYVGC